jgi:hypothetical protein
MWVTLRKEDEMGFRRGRMKIVSDLKVHHTATVLGTDKFIISILPGAVASRAPPLPFDGVITWKSEKCRLIFWQSTLRSLVGSYIPASMDGWIITFEAL